jgi:hypothetical protein
MNNSEQHTEKLIQYLDGELSSSEKTTFEKLLSENEGLQQELENLNLAKMAVRSYGLKNQVASVRGEMINEFKIQQKSPEAKIYPFIRTTLKYAASVFLVLFSMGIYLYITSSSSTLYKENYATYKLSITRGEPVNSPLERAFNTGNYNEVINSFKALKNPGNKEYFLVGQAYQSTHQTNNTIQAFMKVLSATGSDNAFRDDASFYLALSYLENNEPKKAEPIFEKIHSDPDHLYHDKVSYWTLLKLKLLAFKSSE